MDVKDIILAASIAKGAGGSGGGVTKEYVDTQVGAVSERVDDIEDVIPSTATPQNPLATAADVSGTAIPSTSPISPITDSADGMVQKLTIYGRSEVVGGDIHSAGEGWSVVRLADLTWSYNSGTSLPFFYTTLPNYSFPTTSTYEKAPLMCNKYATTTQTDRRNKGISGYSSSTSSILISDTDYTTLPDFVASLGDATLAYKLADPTQGNAIAIKTDDGTGINGTMAVFETALPLRGVSDTVRDKLICTADVKQVETVCGEVDLGTIYAGIASGTTSVFTCSIPLMKQSQTISERLTNLLCPLYELSTSPIASNMPNMSMMRVGTLVYIRNDAYTNTSAFITAMSGVKLVYELATPATAPLNPEEISAFRGLRTYDSTTNVTISDEPEFELDYLKSTGNGQAVADIQRDLQGQIDNLKIKTLTYTGTGTSTNTITFPEIPVCIFSFVNQQRDSYGNFNWTNPFTWNSPYITIYYTGSSSGSQSSAVSYTGNTMTLTGSDAGLAMNRSDTEYNIYYI